MSDQPEWMNPMLATLWKEPVKVAQVSFTEWTKHGNLRHPSFLGLRKDKNPREVIKERAHA